MSKPTAMMSRAFRYANSCVCSGFNSCLNRNFSSSGERTNGYAFENKGTERFNLPVSWMTNGTSNTSCNHLYHSYHSGRHGLDRHSLGKREWNHMAKVHAVTTWPTASVQEPGLALFVAVQNGVKVSVTSPSAWCPVWLEPKLSSDAHVRLPTCNLGLVGHYVFHS